MVRYRDDLDGRTEPIDEGKGISVRKDVPAAAVFVDRRALRDLDHDPNGVFQGEQEAAGGKRAALRIPFPSPLRV